MTGKGLSCLGVALGNVVSMLLCSLLVFASTFVATGHGNGGPLLAVSCLVEFNRNNVILVLVFGIVYMAIQAKRASLASFARSQRRARGTICALVEDSGVVAAACHAAFAELQGMADWDVHAASFYTKESGVDDPCQAVQGHVCARRAWAAVHVPANASEIFVSGDASAAWVAYADALGDYEEVPGSVIRALDAFQLAVSRHLFRGEAKQPPTGPSLQSICVASPPTGNQVLANMKSMAVILPAAGLFMTPPIGELASLWLPESALLVRVVSAQAVYVLYFAAYYLVTVCGNLDVTANAVDYVNRFQTPNLAFVLLVPSPSIVFRVAVCLVALVVLFWLGLWGLGWSGRFPRLYEESRVWPVMNLRGVARMVALGVAHLNFYIWAAVALMFFFPASFHFGSCIGQWYRGP